MPLKFGAVTWRRPLAGNPGSPAMNAHRHGNCYPQICVSGSHHAAWASFLQIFTENNAMDDLSMEERIRVRAYELWEKDGRPDGHDDEYWHKARTSVESEASAVPTEAKAPAEAPATSKPEKGGKA